MGRIITVLLVGLAPIIVLAIRECAPAHPSLAPAAPTTEIVIPVPEPVELPLPEAEPTLPEDIPAPVEPEEPVDAGDEPPRATD